MHFYSTSHFQLIFSFYIFLTCLVVIYGCESWTIKKVSWTARRSNQSILKEISPGVHWKDSCCGWNSSTLPTSCEELTNWKRSWCWEGLRAGGEGEDRGWDGWMASPTHWTWVWVNPRVGDGQGDLACCDSWGCKESDMTECLSTNAQENWSQKACYDGTEH